MPCLAGGLRLPSIRPRLPTSYPAVTTQVGLFRPLMNLFFVFSPDIFARPIVVPP